MTSRRITMSIAALALLAAGCGSSAPAATTTTSTSTTPAAAVTTSTTTVAATTTTTTADPATDSLLLNISIHVEGHNTEVRDEAEYRAHVAEVREVADAAAAAGVSLSFELSAPFVTAAIAYGDTIATDLVAQGHAVGVHADLDEAELHVFEARLTAMRETLAAAGVDTAFVSGICSSGPWVEAAISAGYTATDGMVEWCLKSLAPQDWPDGYEYVADCASPSECHGSIPGGLTRALHPWLSSSSADWLTEDPDGELMLIGGSGEGLHCLSEHAAGLEGRCASDSEDITRFIDLISESVAARAAGSVNVLTLSWSIGNVTSYGFAADMFAAVDSAFDDTEVAWSTIPEIEAAART